MSETPFIGIKKSLIDSFGKSSAEELIAIGIEVEKELRRRDPMYYVDRVEHDDGYVIDRNGNSITDKIQLAKAIYICGILNANQKEK